MPHAFPQQQSASFIHPPTTPSSSHPSSPAPPAYSLRMPSTAPSAPYHDHYHLTDTASHSFRWPVYTDLTDVARESGNLAAASEAPNSDEFLWDDPQPSQSPDHWYSTSTHFFHPSAHILPSSSPSSSSSSLLRSSDSSLASAISLVPYPDFAESGMYRAKFGQDTTHPLRMGTHNHQLDRDQDRRRANVNSMASPRLPYPASPTSTLSSLSASSSPLVRPSSAPTTASNVKQEEEQIDGFVFEMPAGSPSSASSRRCDTGKFSASPSLAFNVPQPIHTLTTTVPLRATQASKEMKKMMGAFRLNPFAVHNGVKVCLSGDGGVKGEGKGKEDGPCLTWLGEEVGPLLEEPVYIDWQIEGWPTEEDEEEEAVEVPTRTSSRRAAHVARPKSPPRPLRRSARHRPPVPTPPSFSPPLVGSPESMLYTLAEEPAEVDTARWSRQQPSLPVFSTEIMSHTSDFSSLPLAYDTSVPPSSSFPSPVPGFQDGHAGYRGHAHVQRRLPYGSDNIIMTPAQGLQWRASSSFSTKDSMARHKTFPHPSSSHAALPRKPASMTYPSPSSSNLFTDVDFFHGAGAAHAVDAQTPEGEWRGSPGWGGVRYGSHGQECGVVN